MEAAPISLDPFPIYTSRHNLKTQAPKIMPHAMDGRIVDYDTTENFEFVEEVGSNVGGCNDGIAVVKRKTDGLICVRKTFIAKKRPNNLGRFDHVKEMKIQQTLRNHRNICAFIEACVTPSVSHMYMENCGTGNLEGLRECMRSVGTCVSEGFVWHVAKSLTSALCFMHLGFLKAEEMRVSTTRHKPGWMPLLHADILTHNIFLKDTGREYPEVKLGDFGRSCYLHEADYGNWVEIDKANENNPINGWGPPESPYLSEQGDIFSLGAVIQSLCNLVRRFDADPKRGVVGYSDNLNTVVKAALRRKRPERPYADELASMIRVFAK